MAFRIRSERVEGVKPMRFREGGKLHYKVRIFIESDDLNDLRKVDSVQYKLHPTFTERYKVSDDITKYFEIIIWTYGFFEAEAKIIKKDGTIETIKGQVRWET